MKKEEVKELINHLVKKLEEVETVLKEIQEENKAIIHENKELIEKNTELQSTLIKVYEHNVKIFLDEREKRRGESTESNKPSQA